MVFFDQLLREVKKKVNGVYEFSWKDGYSVTMIENYSIYPEFDQYVWISKKEFLIIESLNFENYVNCDYNEYQDFLDENDKIKKDSYRLRIKFKKKYILYAISLVIIMMLDASCEKDGRNNAKIYVNNKMVPIFWKFDLSPSEWKNYNHFSCEALYVDKDLTKVADIFVDGIGEYHEIYIVGRSVRSIFDKAATIYYFDTPHFEDDYLFNLEFDRVQKIKKEHNIK